MENRAGSHRSLNSALTTMTEISVRLTTGSSSAAGAHKSVGPAHSVQAIDAPTLGAESFFKFHECLWVVFVHETNTTTSNYWS